MKQILETELDRMYDHYIDLRCKVIHSRHGSMDEEWYGGCCKEAEKWLALFGVDTSYNATYKAIVKRYKEKYGESIEYGDY